MEISKQILRRRMPPGLKASGVPDSIAQIDTNEGVSGGGLVRTISTFQLMLIGVGTSIGTGIFFILSEAVPEAGPAVVVSFLLAALVAGLTVVCYAELASMMPSSGSSYTYTYATLGELAAFVVGSCLVLEYGVAAAAVSVGWAQYLNLFLENAFHFTFPPELSGSFESGGIINVPAIVLVLMCAALLVRGTKESAVVNAIMVAIKIGVLILFAGIAFTGFQVGNFSDFAPFGFAGISLATSQIFFSFLGLDVVATAGEEVKDPQRTIPRALLGALGIVTAVYVMVAVAAIGAQQWTKFQGQKASLATIIQDMTGSTLPGTIMAIGAIISIFSVTLTCLFGQTRVLYSMGRDGLIPKPFGRINPKTHVPQFNILVVAVVVSILAGLVPLDTLASLVSVGTLTAFGLVAVGVMVLRKTAPHIERGFKVPGFPVTPILSIIACIYVIVGMKPVTLIAFACWMVLTFAVYFLWSRKHSELQVYGEVETVSSLRENT